MDTLLNEISHDRYLFSVEDFMPSAWTGHAPFLKFLVREMQPRTFVELGVHNGFSYFVGCQAIQECKIQTKAFAIDHWVGDSQAGFFDESVYQGVVATNQKYSAFSTLLKMSFDEALKHFGENSIDLLHVDGFHSYESVRKDFETWLPKMSTNGVVLLHDIHVRRDTFGVYKFWDELKIQFKTIEFVGSHGLGVVFLGDIPSGKIKRIFDYAQQGHIGSIQGTFGSISDDLIHSSQTNKHAIALAERDSALAERDSALAERDSALAERDSALAERDSALAERDSALAERDSALAERDSALAERDSALAERDSALAERDSALAERDSVINSTSWKVLLPYRKAINLILRK